MTVREYIGDFCYQRGMSEARYKKVVDLVVAHKANEGLGIRWDDDIKGYPPEFRTGFDMLIEDVALKLIDEECPDAWYREAFVR